MVTLKKSVVYQDEATVLQTGQHYVLVTVCFGAIFSNLFADIFCGCSHSNCAYFFCLFPADDVFLTFFRTALQANFLNGTGQNWLHVMFSQFLVDHPEWEHTIMGDQPTRSSG